MQPADSHRRYWRKNLAVTAVLLLVWFSVTFGVSYFARALSFRFFGWPFSFWMGAQGALVVYCLTALAPAGGPNSAFPAGALMRRIST